MLFVFFFFGGRGGWGGGGGEGREGGMAACVDVHAPMTHSIVSCTSSVYRYICKKSKLNLFISALETLEIVYAES